MKEQGLSIQTKLQVVCILCRHADDSRSCMQCQRQRNAAMQRHAMIANSLTCDRLITCEIWWPSAEGVVRNVSRPISQVTQISYILIGRSWKSKGSSRLRSSSWSMLTTTDSCGDLSKWMRCQNGTEALAFSIGMVEMILLSESSSHSLIPLESFMVRADSNANSVNQAGSLSSAVIWISSWWKRN